MKRKIDITLHGQKFVINTDASEEYIRGLENFVNASMKHVEGKFPSKINYKIALLAALNIADEYFKYKIFMEEFRKKVQEKSRKMVDSINSVIRN